MKSLLAILFTILITWNAMSQNKYPMKIAMVSVFVENPVKAFKYYTEVLGLEEIMLFSRKLYSNSK